MQRVGGSKNRRAPVGQRLLVCAIEHRLSEIATEERRSMRGGVAQFVHPNAFKRESQIAGATAQIEDARVGAAQSAPEQPCHPPAP